MEQKNTRMKRGTERADGMLFWQYKASCPNGEWWTTPDQYHLLYSRECHREWLRRRTDPTFNLKKRIRARLGDAFRRGGYKKTTKTCEMLGCTFEELKMHIELQFQEGMTWENMGQWQIDHILPLAAASTLDDMIKLAHYTNLQPLWAEENLNKRDSYNAQELDAYLTR